MRLTYREVLSDTTSFIYNALASERKGNGHIELLSSIDRYIPGEFFVNDPKIHDYLLNYLDPDSWNLSKESEQMSLMWISAVLSSYLLFKVIDPIIFNLFLKSITYNGLLFLYDHYFQQLDTSYYTNSQKFNFYKSVAKLYKSKGNIIEAQLYYGKAIEISAKTENIEQFSYSLSLQAKLYSDYLQRKGLCLAFSKISYDRIKSIVTNSNKISLSIQICIDSYAKEVYRIDEKFGHDLFSKLLKNSYISRDKNRFNRIKFRFLESQMWSIIKKNDFTNKESNKHLISLLKSYENLLKKTENNPKAFYIRNMHLLKVYRELKYHHIDSLELSFIKNRINKLSDKYAIYILDDCINQAKLFNDRKFEAKAYFEYSFWIKENEKLTKDFTLKQRVEALEKSRDIFKNADKFSIISEIYVEVLERLAYLYVQLKEWDKALNHYSKLYDYLTFLTTQLEKDYEIIDKFNKDNNVQDIIDNTETPYSRFNKDELRLTKEFLLLDYKSLTVRLLDYGSFIREIQNIMTERNEELFVNFINTITHDIKHNLNGFRYVLSSIEDLLPINQNEDKIITQLILGRQELEKALNVISTSNLQTEGSIFVPKKINIVKEIIDVTSFLQKHSPESVIIKFDCKLMVHAKLHRFILTRMIVNLVENILFMGTKNKIEKVEIELDLLIENNYLYFSITDNCGDSEEFPFTEIIDSLNSNQEIGSLKHASKRGSGLINIKRLLPDCKWELIILDEFRKCLKLPLILESDIEYSG